MVTVTEMVAGLAARAMSTAPNVNNAAVSDASIPIPFLRTRAPSCGFRAARSQRFCVRDNSTPMSLHGSEGGSEP